VTKFLAKPRAKIARTQSGNESFPPAFRSGNLGEDVPQDSLPIRDRPSPGSLVKVYLLLLDEAESFFYSDDPEPGEAQEREAEGPRPGLWGWIERRWRALQRAFHEADAGVALWAHRTWDWLHALTRPDESMLVRLRSAERVDLHHPASLDRSAVAAIWTDYLTRRSRSHRIRLVYNGILAGPALALLWPLPGPNVIGFWFAYRFLHHWMIIRGIGAVRRDAIPTHYHPEPSLDEPVQRDSDGKARHGAIEGREHRLAQYLHRTGPRGSGRAAGLVRVVVPNALSFLRIALGLAFPWAPRSWRGGLVVAAGLSDLFDGRLSRALGGTSTLGQILDPVADKLFVGIVLVTLVVEGELTTVEVLLLGFRDLAVLVGSAWSVVRHGWGCVKRMPPSLPGKLATAGQLGFLLLLTLIGRDATLLIWLVEVAAATLSVLAGLDYLRRKSPTPPPTRP
jgi:phosphatidylglycerophosphate synthase